MAARRLFLALAFASFAAVAPVEAQLPSIPQFSGQVNEMFELAPFGAAPCVPVRIFSHNADLCTPSGAHCYLANSSSCSCSTCVLHAHWLATFFVALHGVWEVTFDTAAQRFGGWYADVESTAVTTFQFFDIDDHLVAVETLATPPPGCTWTWFGWNLSGGPPIKRILAQSTTGFFYIDDLQADLAPLAPTPYCTAGTTSHGCAASISANANPKVSHTTPCQLTVSGVEGQKLGVLYYGLTKQLVPWCTGGAGTSVLCVKPPILSTAMQSSGGASGQCNGVFHFDWNAFQLAHPGALGSPWMASEKVFVQTWFRDPPACRSLSLSNALELTYRP
jgi:hypothetical protein